MTCSTKIKNIKYFKTIFTSFISLQLLVLRNEKESLSNAEKKAYNVIRNNLQVLKVIVSYCWYIICNSFAPTMQFNLTTMQISVQENVAEKRKLEEHIRIVEACFLHFFFEMKENYVFSFVLIHCSFVFYL